MLEFESFHKIARLNRHITVTEKLDGTNAQVCILELPDGLLIENFEKENGVPLTYIYTPDSGNRLAIFAGSRSRWITPTDDNYGFATWVLKNMIELSKLGPGRHYGEWWGGGVQRGYGLLKGEKRFSLFNTARWNNETPPPACCHVVPVLYRGGFQQPEIKSALEFLATHGSLAAPGFMRPEGVVIYHEAAKQLFKVTLENDGVPKGTVGVEVLQ